MAGTGGAAHLRREVGVNRLMHMLKRFYWMREPIELAGEGGKLRQHYDQWYVVQCGELDC